MAEPIYSGRPPQKALKAPPSIAFNSEGAKGILIELADEPKKAQKYARRWESLTSSVAKSVREKLKGKTGREREEAFMGALWEVMRSTYNMSFDHERYSVGIQTLLHDFLDSMKFDCDSSAIFTYDVAKKAGFNPRLASAPKNLGVHAFILLGHTVLEPTGGVQYPLGKLHDIYPSHRILRENQIRAIAHSEVGEAFLHKAEKEYRSSGEVDAELYKRAAQHFTEAIKLVPDFAFVYGKRGIAYMQIDMEKALKDHLKAAELDPASSMHASNVSLAYLILSQHKKQGEFEEMAIERIEGSQKLYGVGKMFYELNQYEKAINSLEKALEMDPNNTRASNILWSARWKLAKSYQ